MTRYFKACTIWLVVNFPTLWACILTLGKCNHFCFEIIDFQLQNEHLELHPEETGNQCSSWSRDVTCIILGTHISCRYLCCCVLHQRNFWMLFKGSVKCVIIVQMWELFCVPESGMKCPCGEDLYNVIDMKIKYKESQKEACLIPLCRNRGLQPAILCIFRVYSKYI